MKVPDNDSGSDTKWADIEADEDYEKPQNLTGFDFGIDEQGIKTFISYPKNNRGQSIKLTKRIKEIKIVKKTHKSVFDRKNLLPFNLDDQTDMGSTLISNEDILLEPSRNERRFNQDESDFLYTPVDTNLLRLTRDLKLKFKSLREEDVMEEEVEEKETTAKYIPPSRKDGAERRSFDENTIRITNLSEDIKEKDLTELFGKVGRIHRAYLAKYKETQNSKGFAFVTYVNKQDAIEAINRFNRLGYNNLLLNVEWAKPAKDR
ncbi:eukaryotic translation initiation factor [Theileria orientalis]|uniref:Eukaryotic translation initiation factor 3 subunit G n=1 Tax=Theileria orientalis TaxID=68886 RepID=A0A976MBU9_THEOR|nr:eukaryotic translation initiation factor [Theileria orientalis]